MRPSPAVINGDAQVPQKSYIFARHFYSTTVPVENPGERGVSMIYSEPRDGDYVFAGKSMTFSKGLTVWNWIESPENNPTKYALTLATTKATSEKVSKAYGIPAIEVYGSIMMAHYDISFHAYIDLWYSRTFHQTPKNDPKEIENDPTGTKGYYTYGVSDLVPDYKYYFEQSSGAMQISGELCKELFDDCLMEDKRKGTSMQMRTAYKENPLNLTAPLGEVVNLGCADGITFDGDAWPILSNGAIYVLTSYRPTPEEKRTICGINANIRAADARFRELSKTQDNFKYQVFVVTEPTKLMDTNEDEVPAEPEAQKRKAEKKTTTTTKSASSKKKAKK